LRVESPDCRKYLPGEHHRLHPSVVSGDNFHRASDHLAEHVAIHNQLDE